MVQWHKFDYDDKKNTAPETYVEVWIVEEFYTNGVTIGWFDGYTFNTHEFKDDCKVSYWAYMSYPDPPEEWAADEEPKEEEYDDEL